MLPSHNVKVRGDAALYTQASYGKPKNVPPSTQLTNNCASTTTTTIRCVFIVRPININIPIKILFIWWIIADRNDNKNDDDDDDDSKDRFIVCGLVCVCACVIRSTNGISKIRELLIGLKTKIIQLLLLLF